MTLFFPRLPGLGWSVIHRVNYSTRISNHVSGREVRTANYARALHEFELTWDGLDSEGLRKFEGLGLFSLQDLRGFYMSAQGQFGTFVYVDPLRSMSEADNVPFGIGDGSANTFALQRLAGTVAGLRLLEVPSFVTSLGIVTANNVATPASLIQPYTVKFATTPAPGAALAASFTYGYVCRFLDDSAEFEQFMRGLRQVKSLKFRQVR